MKSLDSLRGLACLSVFLCHTTNEKIRYKTFNILASGNEAVILFFVLSGFVLTMAYNKNSKFDFLSYAIRRVFRIYPAYYFAILLAIVSGLTSRIVSDNMLVFYLHTFLLLPQTSILNNLDAPAWSLAYEMIISIAIMPIMWRLKDCRRSFNALVCVMILFSLYIGYFIYLPILSGFPIANKLIGIPYYSSFFALGVLLFEYRNVFQHRSNGIFFFVSLLLYFNFYISYRYGSQVVTAIGACGIIMAAINNQQIKKILEHKILLFYGKISFSFYILHIILIQSVPQYVPSFIYPKSVVTLIITTLLAYISYKYIEVPFVKVGNKILKR